MGAVATDSCAPRRQPAKGFRARRDRGGFAITKTAYSAQHYALRDLGNTDRIVFRHVAECGLVPLRRMLDLGCGAGRSARFLRDLGCQVTGVDHSAAMIAEARRRDPHGDYREIPSAGPLPFSDATFEAVFSSWMIQENGREEDVVRLLKECRRVVSPMGSALIVTNTPEFYTGDWLSCRTDHPENALPLRSGQLVKATLLPEGVVVSDYFWSDADYRRFFAAAGFVTGAAHRPLGRADDGLPWRDELTTPPYVIYELHIPR